MIGNFNDETQHILVKAKMEMINLKHPYIGTEHLILAILSEKNELRERLKEYNLTYDKFKKEIIRVIGIGSKKSELFLYTPLLKKVIENAILDSKDNNDGEVTVNHLFSALLEIGEGIAIRTLIGMNLDVENMYDEFSYKLIKRDRNKKNKSSILLEYGIDLTEKAKRNELDPVIGRENELQRLIEVLCRRCKNNPILIGEPGVGKTAIVEELCKMIVQKKVTDNLINKKIISLDMATLVAGTKYRGEFEERMKKIVKEAEEDDDIILFIDEIHTLVGAGGAEGAIDASNILKPALARGKIRCIGATTIKEYKKHIEKDGALERRFQKILIKEPDLGETSKILLKLKPIYEKYHGVKIKDEILDNIIELSNKYIYDRYFPDKAIDILDETCSMVSIKEDTRKKEINKVRKRLEEISTSKNNYIIENKIDKAYCYRKEENLLKSKLNKLELEYKNNLKKQVELEDVAKVIHNKTTIPIYEILRDNVKVIKEIEDNLSKKIIGQDKAISELINITKRIKLGYKENKCYSMLFVGPSGVGKTKLASEYAKYLVGEKNFIRIDMSEFSESVSINKIIGSSPGYVGYDDNNNVLEEIRNKPNSVILLDEIDKAHPNVINLFYQALDEGVMKDSKGNLVKFNNCIIIMTSNVGYERQEVGFISNNNNFVNASLKQIFNLSFINRIDNIINFNFLSEDNIREILIGEYQKIKIKYNNINISFNDNFTNKLIKEINYNEYGARKINKIIKNIIENNIIDKIIGGDKDITFDVEEVSQTLVIV